MPRHDELIGLAHVECGVCGFQNALMKQDLVVKCERCGQVQALPSASRSAQEIADAEETEVIIDELAKGTETTALLNFRSSDASSSSEVGGNLIAVTLTCDVCHAALFFPERTFAQRCTACKVLVIRNDAPIREGHKLLRCNNGNCHCLFLFLTGSTSYVRCPECRTLRCEEKGQALRCPDCYRFFQSDNFTPSIKCPHCSACMFSGFSLKTFWAWIGGGLIFTVACFIVILLFLVSSGAGGWNGFPEAILFFVVGLIMVIWPILACLCCRRRQTISWENLEESLPYSEIQHPEALDESVNERSFFI